MVTGKGKLMVWGITFSLIWGGDIQTLGCCQKFTLIPPPHRQRCLLGQQCALVWANRQPIEQGPVVPCVPSATIGHGDDMDLAIHPGLGFGLGPRLRAGLRRRMGLTGAVNLLCRPLLTVLLGVGLEAPLSMEGAGVRAPTNELLCESCAVAI